MCPTFCWLRSASDWTIFFVGDFFGLWELHSSQEEEEGYNCMKAGQLIGLAKMRLSP